MANNSDPNRIQPNEVFGSKNPNPLFQFVRGIFGGHSAPPAVAPIDSKTLGTLTGMGIPQSDAQTILGQIAQTQGVAKLPAQYQAPVQAYFAKKQQEAELAKQQQPFIDPLQMQAFFANTIMPYLGQRADQTNDQINSLYNSQLRNLPANPVTRSLMQQLIPQQQAAALAQHQANVSSFAPSMLVQSVMQQLAKSQQAQEQYATQIRNQAATSALSGLLGGGAFSATG